MGNSSSIADEKIRVEIRATEERMKWERELAAARFTREQEETTRFKMEQELAAARIKMEQELAAARIKMEQEETAARIKKLKEEITAIETRNRIRNVGLDIGLAAIGILFIDFIIHGFNPYIKRRVKRSFLKMPPSVATHNLIPLDSRRSSFLHVVEDMARYPVTPRVLLGPTGCGKSTLLKIVANMYCKNGLRPVKFISIRGAGHSKNNPPNDVTPTCEDDAFSGNSEAFKNITEAILKQIDYPIRRPIIEEFFFSSILSFKLGDNVKANLRYKNMINEDRLSAALSMLVDCAVELRNEKGEVPLIIFDEIHDLVRVSRFRDVGGLRTFLKLADQAVIHNVNYQDINFLFAGNSSISG